MNLTNTILAASISLYTAPVIYNYLIRYPEIATNWKELEVKYRIAAALMYPMEGYFLDRAQ